MRCLLALPLLLVLAACSDTAPPPQDAAKPVADDAGRAQADVGSILPGGVRFDIPAQLRSDKSYSTRAGAMRRRLVYELLEATPDQAETAVTAVFSRAGYKGEEAKPGKDGQFTIRYRKRGAPNVIATFYPGLAKKPANPAAKSMVAFSWQTKKAPKKKA